MTIPINSLQDSQPKVILLFTEDPLARASIERVAKEVGFLVVDDPTQAGVEGPDVIVIDLQRHKALEGVQGARLTYPDALIVGHISAPDQDLWVEAERGGCDLVLNKGSLAVQLRRRLKDVDRVRRRRYPLIDESEVAGRLGLVRRFSDTPVGPLALYQVNGSVFCLEDVCPHAGAILSEGLVEGSVVTCPFHGSQFDVCTGSRLRGPADLPVCSYDLVIEGGRIFLVWA